MKRLGLVILYAFLAVVLITAYTKVHAEPPAETLAEANRLNCEASMPDELDRVYGQIERGVPLVIVRWLVRTDPDLGDAGRALLLDALAGLPLTRQQFLAYGAAICSLQPHRSTPIRHRGLWTAPPQEI